jgi:predicted DsbA family dithiol-disulfide isomerase
MERIRITHFSDVLCVWAYVSQIRVDELRSAFLERVDLNYRYFHVFGNVAKKMEASWRDRGGLGGYSEHVRSVVGQFAHVVLHPKVWVHDTPQSSMPAHVFLCAMRLLEAAGGVPAGTQERAAWEIRQAFFRDAQDVSRQDVLLGIAQSLGLPGRDIEDTLNSGAAHAALCEDLDLARAQAIQASPTLLFNEGRQRLTGNVGYRIIEANIRELLERAPDQLSWC